MEFGRTWTVGSVILAAVWVLAIDIPASAGACPEAAERLRAGNHGGAADAARACLDRDLESPGTWMLLAQALAWQGRYDAALVWAGIGARRHPEDPSWSLLQGRILAWKGQLEAAWDLVDELPLEALADPEDLRFVGDLAFWRQDHEEADRRYSIFLEAFPDDTMARRNRGIVRRDSGDTAGALGDFDVLCEAGSREGCLLADQERISRARFALLMNFGHTFVQDHPDWWAVGLSLQARVLPRVNLGLATELRPRRYGENVLSDMYIEFQSSVDVLSWFTLRAAGGLSVRPRYSPNWAIRIEPVLRVVPGVELGILFWRLDFQNSPASVVSPSILFESGRWNVVGRYYLTVRDDSTTAHAGFAKLGFRIAWPWTAFVGGGAGNRTDYLELRGDPNAELHWTLVAGISWQMNWRFRILLDWMFREERSGPARFRQNRLGLAWETRF
jgi:hypothetical protein